MKVLVTSIKQALFAAALMIPFGNSSWGQTYNFENSCSNYSNSFALGCISNWISTSGTPDTYGNIAGWPAPQGSRYAHMYAKWDGTCATPQGAEGIALNYSFQSGKTYRITYHVIGTGANAQISSKSNDWILTNGLINKSGGACTPNEVPPAIPVGSQTVGTPTYAANVWTQNQHTFTANANFSQLWFRYAITSTISNYPVTASIAIDAFTIEEICIPTPAIAGPNTFCQGSAMSFNGSITNGCSITNNVWTVVESDQFGNPVSGATEWWSPWATGTPGTLNIPSVANGGPNMPCGKYYKIKLAVQNTYTSWAETSKIIYVNCPPSFKLKGSSSTMCYGGTAILNATLNSGNPANHTLNWTPIAPAGTSVYNGPMASVVVSPSVTTTYQVTVTDNITGCSASQQWTVTVENTNPAFNITTNASNPNFLMVAASPVVTSGHPAGFGYAWFIDELDAGGNSVYSVSSGTIAPCWWPGNGATTTFPGFNGLSQVINTMCTPTNGMFKYNTSYRITRGTWSTNCPWTQISYTLVYTKSGEWVFEEDHKAPDMSLALSQSDQQIELSVSPNPANDKVSISTSTIVSGELRVTDLSGRVVYNIQLKAGENSIELSVGDYSPGTYLVQIVGDNNVQSTEKLVITE